MAKIGILKEKKLGLLDQHVINTNKNILIILKHQWGWCFLTKKTNTSTPSKSMGNPRNP